MIVKKLASTSLDEVIDCFLAAFDNYYVEMPTYKNYYIERWKAAKVDLNLSYGMFHHEKLVGFIIHAIDERNGSLTAFNTGTGVLPDYRGKGIVKSIYNYALKDLVENGVKKSVLEVITENTIAVRTYEGIGFEIRRKLRCFYGTLKVTAEQPVEMEEMDLQNMDWKCLPNQMYYSWDNQWETLVLGNYTFYYVLNKKKRESYFIINAQSGYVAQFDLLNSKAIGWHRLYSAIKKVSNPVKINNVDERLKSKLDSLMVTGIEHVADQYEMALEVRN